MTRRCLLALAACLPALAAPVAGAQLIHFPRPQPANAPPVGDGNANLPDESGTQAIITMRRHASAIMRDLVRVDDTRRFLISSTFLPVIDRARTVYISKETPGGDPAAEGQFRTVISSRAWGALTNLEKEDYKPQVVDGDEFYNGRYGSPLMMFRPLDLVGQALPDAFEGRYLRNKRVLDFGFGSIGALRMLASLGCDAVGVDPDPYPFALYSEPADTGRVDGAALYNDEHQPGTLTLVRGRWPADESIISRVGGSYDLIVSKNTLKNGYVNPAPPPEGEKPTNPRLLVHLGVSNDDFVRAVAGALKPGGFFIIYNLSPKTKPGARAVPWADGRSPFTREQFEQHGFEVLAFDQDDTQTAIAAGGILGWDSGPSAMNLAEDLGAMYTLVRKK